MAEIALFPEEALVEIQKINSTAINVTTDVDSFTEGGFEREVEFRPFFHNAKVTIQKQQNPGEITLNAKVTRTVWDEMLWGGSGSDFTSGGTQSAYRLTFLVTKDPAYTNFDATATIASGSIASYDTYRKAYANCYLTSFNPKLEVEGMLEGEAKFMVSPTDEAGDANIRIQIGTTGFAALGSYTSSQKWVA
jgi:hypothetical protein